MYFSRQPLPERAVRELRSLHFSLNTPVVAIENLAVGPARAAIALQDLGDGNARLNLVVRSQRTSQLACFSHDEPLAGEASTQIALDGALSFAESMGFLFDDDAIPDLGADGPREAADAWNVLLGLVLGELPAQMPEAPPAAEPALASAIDDSEDEDTLETDDDGEHDDELEVDPEPDAEQAPAELWLEELVAPPQRLASPQMAIAEAPANLPAAPVLLTKFRRSAAVAQGVRRNGWPIRLLSHF